METKNEGEDVVVEENLDLPQVVEGEDDTTDWKAEAQKLQNKAISQRERTKTLKRELAEARKAVGVVASSKETPSQPKTGELDETQLDYFDLKGYSDSDEVDVFHKIMLKTGMSAREVLKDEYALAKVKSIRDAKAVQSATPGSTRRAGDQTGDIASAVAKFEATGILPDDFELASKITDAVTAKGNKNKPSWH